MNSKDIKCINDFLSEKKQKEEEIKILKLNLRVYAMEYYNNFYELFIDSFFDKYKDINSIGIAFDKYGIDKYNYTINGEDAYLQKKHKEKIDFLEKMIFDKLSHEFWENLPFFNLTWNIFYRDGRRTETNSLPVGTKESKFQKLIFSKEEEIIRKARYRDTQIDSILEE